MEGAAAVVVGASACVVVAGPCSVSDASTGVNVVLNGYTYVKVEEQKIWVEMIDGPLGKALGRAKLGPFKSVGSSTRDNDGTCEQSIDPRLNPKQAQAGFEASQVTPYC